VVIHLLVASLASLVLGLLLGRLSAAAIPALAGPAGDAGSRAPGMAPNQAGPGEGTRPARRLRRRRLGASGTLTVQLSGTGSAREVVERILREESSRLELDEVQRGPAGTLQLRYVVGFARDREPEAVLSTLIDRGRPHVLGVTWH
jgi:hypothetical protein